MNIGKGVFYFVEKNYSLYSMYLYYINPNPLIFDKRGNSREKRTGITAKYI